MHEEHRISIDITELIEFQPDSCAGEKLKWWCRLCSPHQPPHEIDVSAIMAAAERHFIDEHRGAHAEEATNG